MLTFLLALFGFLLALTSLARPPRHHEQELSRIWLGLSRKADRADLAGLAHEAGTLAAIGQVKAQVDALDQYVQELPSFDDLAGAERCAARNVAARLRDLADALVAGADFEATEGDFEAGVIAPDFTPEQLDRLRSDLEGSIAAKLAATRFGPTAPAGTAPGAAPDPVDAEGSTAEMPEFERLLRGALAELNRPRTAAEKAARIAEELAAERLAAERLAADADPDDEFGDADLIDAEGSTAEMPAAPEPCACPDVLIGKAECDGACKATEPPIARYASAGPRPGSAPIPA